MTVQRDCSIPAPAFYRTVMHVSHVVSYPMYIITLIILFKEPSKPFQSYKYFIIVHILINMATETYVSFLMLPVTYLPHLLIRTTGILAHLGFSGIFQWYVLATFVMLTGGSICEMFYYRFQVSVFDYQKHKMSWYILFAKWTYRGLVVGHVIFAACTINESIYNIQEASVKLLLAEPTLVPEITCYSTVLGLPGDYINTIVALIYTMSFLIAVTSAISCLLFIFLLLKKNERLSKTTVRMQTMFVFSLGVQTAVHGIMIAGPGAVFLYTLFSSFNYDDLALLMLVCVAYHGFFSLLAMIMFTKPIRDKMLCRKNVREKVVVSISQTQL